MQAPRWFPRSAGIVADDAALPPRPRIAIGCTGWSIHGTLAARFLAALRRRHDGAVACEPRHASWFAQTPDRLLAAHRVARVVADPPRVPAAAEPGGWTGMTYIRLHGSPVMYRSDYDDAFLERIAELTRGRTGPAWCFFDNTMLNAAMPNPLALMERLDDA